MSTTDSISPVAVVTGGARGIGLAIAEWFLAHGHRIALLDIDSDTLFKTEAKLAQPDKVLALRITPDVLPLLGVAPRLGRVFVDRLIEEHIKGTPIVKETSMAKWWVTEMCKRNIDLCLQFYGGYGYMEEYPVCRAYRDARIQTIFAGTTEIMKIIIAKSMGL